MMGIAQVATEPVGSIMHPTDFTVASELAFDHALRIALSSSARLHILHVASDPKHSDLTSFPKVRRTLTEWGLLPEGSPQHAVASQLGIRLSKIELVDSNAVHGIISHLKTDPTPTDLIVLATHGRHGPPRWIQGSIAESATRQARVPGLFIRHGARGFVLPNNGEVLLRRVLIPVDHEPSPAPALAAAWNLATLLNASNVVLHLLHIGDKGNIPTVGLPLAESPHIEWMARGGDVVDGILDIATELNVDLIAMSTAGRQGFLDAFRGSTTERILRHAPCPVLAVPVLG